MSFPVLKLPNGVSVGPWTITTTKSHISGADDLARLSSELDLPLPAMVYADNVLRVEREGKLVIEFTPIAALRLVDNRSAPVQVCCAKEWAHQRQHSAHFKTARPYDWTFTTPYSGTLGEGVKVEATTTKLDLNELRRPEPIIFYDEVYLFEDELSDFGSATLSVKVRVMPAAFYILQRFFLHVDGVLERSHETRVHHQFGRDFVLREHCLKESLLSDGIEAQTSAPRLQQHQASVAEHLWWAGPEQS